MIRQAGLGLFSWWNQVAQKTSGNSSPLDGLAQSSYHFCHVLLAKASPKTKPRLKRNRLSCWEELLRNEGIISQHSLVCATWIIHPPPSPPISPRLPNRTLAGVCLILWDMGRGQSSRWVRTHKIPMLTKKPSLSHRESTWHA